MKKTKKLRNRREPVDVIEVVIWGQRVGAVALNPQFNFYTFSYDPKFIKKGIQLSPLQMPLSDTTVPISSYQFTELPEATYRRLPAMISDSLPDDFGNALIDRYLADQGMQKSQITALDQLAYMGSRGMGALEYKPRRGPTQTDSAAIEMGQLVKKAREVVSGYIHTDGDSEAALRNIIEVGTSAGGARAKAVIGLNPKTFEIRSGQIELPEGFEHWLLKFDIGSDQELGTSQNFGRVEYAYSLMAKSAGIEMTECKLLEENDRAHFMTKRFDRVKSTEAGALGSSISKIHCQTLCAMSHLDYKKIGANSYEQLFLTLSALNLPRVDFLQSFRRMCFNILARNCDDHTKNISFVLPEGGNWRLSPAYDVSFAYNPQSQWVSKHLMSVNGKWNDHKREDLLLVADRFGLGEAKSILSEVIDAVSRWQNFAKQANLPESEINRIDSEIRKKQLSLI